LIKVIEDDGNYDVVAKHEPERLFELIKVDLMRSRDMAEKSGDRFLQYLIDMAILQAQERIMAARLAAAKE
jgi:hypothetical protein